MQVNDTLTEENWITMRGWRSELMPVQETTRLIVHGRFCTIQAFLKLF